MLEKRSLGLGNPMLPCLSKDQIASYSRVLSVTITGNQVSWSLIRKSSSDSVHLEALWVKDFELVPKVHFLNVLKQVTGTGSLLPSLLNKAKNK